MNKARSVLQTAVECAALVACALAAVVLFASLLGLLRAAITYLPL